MLVATVNSKICLIDYLKIKNKMLQIKDKYKIKKSFKVMSKVMWLTLEVCCDSSWQLFIKYIEEASDLIDRSGYYKCPQK